MNTKYKNASLLTIAIAFVLSLAGVGSSFAQSNDWRVTSSERVGDVLTIVERASDGRTKTTEVHYFRHKPTTTRSDNQVIKDRDGNRLNTRYARWTDDGREIEHGDESYDKAGYTSTGTRWRYEEENGRIVEPRINERFNERTKKWERVEARIDLSGEWIGTGYYCEGAQPPERIRIQHVGDQVTAVKIKGDPCIRDGEVTFRGAFTRSPFTGQMHVLDGERRHFIEVSITIENKDTIRAGGVVFRRAGS